MENDRGLCGISALINHPRPLRAGILKDFYEDGQYPYAKSELEYEPTPFKKCPIQDIEQAKQENDGYSN